MLKLNIPTENIKTILEKSIRIAPKKSSVPASEEVCLITNTDSNTLTIIATDSETAIISTLQVDYSTISNNDNKYIIKDSKSLTKAFKYFKEHITNITINEENNTITFENEETLIILKKIEGDYFNYSHLFNEKSTYTMQTDNKQIQEGLLYLKTFNKESKPIIKFIGDTMTLNNTDISFTIDNIESYNNTIGFNCDYMLDALKQIDEDTVTINMASNVNPIIIQNEEGNNKALILPVMLDK